MNGKQIEIEKLINYKFKNIKLLKFALTHSSYLNEHNLKYEISNERLEFLGDAVLDLVIGEYFFLKYVNLKEGSLSKLRANVVDENSLFEIAKKLNLGDYMLFGKGEIKNKGNRRPSTLSDCLEALCGAIYLDSDIETVKKVILALFENRIKEVEKLKNKSDYKTAMQEYAQKRNKNIKYVLLKEQGPDNSKVFYSNVLIDGKVVGTGKGPSKKKSQQAAAKKALESMEALDE